MTVPPNSGLPEQRVLTEPQRRRARRIATIVFLALVSSWVLGISLEIVKQAMWPEVRPNPYGSCSDGQAQLAKALERARTTAESDLEPDVALDRFRAALDPEWGYLEGVRTSCGSKEELRSLDALERLRYAEERAVRREAASLAALRRQVESDVAPR